MNLAGVLVALVLTVTTQNVRVGMSPEHSHHDINQAAAHSSILFTQEMGLRRAARFAPQHWGTSHHAGLRQGDCATYWDRRVWSERRSYITRLTHAPFRAGTRYALTTILHLRGHPGVTIGAVCVHMITKSLARRAVYANGMDRLRAMMSRIPYRVVVGGDWNRTFPRRAPLSGFRTLGPHRPTGVHGGRIDYIWGRDARPRHIRVIGHTWSDHNGVRYQFRIPDSPLPRGVR